MKQIIFSIILVISTATYVGASILDQAQEHVDPVHFVICSDWLIAQTFTTGMSGQLEIVDLYLENIFASNSPFDSMGPPSYPITVAISETVNGIPSGNILGQVYVDSFIQGFNAVNFLSEDVILFENTQYAIILSSTDQQRYDSTSTQWRGALEDVYSGGAMWLWSLDTGWTQSVQPPDSLPVETFYDKDAAFVTYMTPEPATLMLISLGSLLIIKMRDKLSRYEQ